MIEKGASILRLALFNLKGTRLFFEVLFEKSVFLQIH